uniref:Protein zwilch n=1 Tax=Salarias fasciatus TaxID=181472 RepID=A0A672FBF9_SALFA
MKGDRLTAVNVYCANQTIFVCEKAVSNVNHETLQFLSWYTLSQNPNVSAVDNKPALLPLWVRCDMSDPSRTTWLGAETVCVANKVTGVKMYSVTCRGSVSLTHLLPSFTAHAQDVKQEHKKRHHPSSMGIKGSARFNLFGSTMVENTMIESQSSVTVDLKWSHVESILETPPLSSTAVLNIKIASGDQRSPMYELYKELEFLQTLADGLRTGQTEWMEPLESTPAVTLTKAYLEGICVVIPKSETDTPVFSSFLERGDLDFVEQLWVRMRKSVTSCQDIADCLKLVIEALRYSDIKPWIHRDSSSSLSKLILQCYHQQIETVSLTGVTPVNMLLEMGLDKMRKDYINYLVGEELTTLKHLSYFLSTEVDLQEQAIRLRKLHHLLEIVVTCSTFLALPYDCLFLLTQSCLQHYKTSPEDEEHEFKLQIKPALISHFYEKEHPVMWGVEVSSGHGPREVRTCFQLSDRPLVDHVIFDTEYPNETVNGDCEDPAFFSTTVCCSLASFA